MEIKKELLKYINLEGLVLDLLLKQVIEKALDKVVTESENKYDDLVKASLWPLIEKQVTIEVKELIAKLNQ